MVIVPSILTTYGPAKILPAGIVVVILIPVGPLIVKDSLMLDLLTLNAVMQDEHCKIMLAALPFKFRVSVIVLSRNVD